MKKALLILFAAAIAAQAHAAAIEVGTNDFRISRVGPDGNANFDAGEPEIVYNAIEDEYLVVFQGQVAATGETEIFARRIDAATGEAVGDDVRISTMGPDGNLSYIASAPAAAYNAQNNEYLVIWRGDDGTDNEYEIYGQRLDAAAAEIGTDDFRISDMGPNGSASYWALAGDVAYNATENQYLVVWAGDDNIVPLVDNEIEIFGQRLDGATGSETGANDFRISDMGPNGNTSFSVLAPQVAYNSVDNEYLVVWHADDNTAPLVNDENEIFGQRLDATGTEKGTNDFRISQSGADGDPMVDALSGAVVHNPARNEYLVLWSVDDGVSFSEVFGRRLDGAGALLGSGEIRVTPTQAEGGQGAETENAEAVYNARNGSYFIVWTESHKDDVVHREVFGRSLDETGNLGGTAMRISDMGPENAIDFEALAVQIASDPSRNGYLVVWQADDEAPLVNDEYEIFGQFLSDAKCGNAFADSGEQCDDGNLTDGDGCSVSCAIEGAPGGSEGNGSGGDSAGDDGANDGGANDGGANDGGANEGVANGGEQSGSASGGTGGGCSLIR